jgi:hypothetical protein
LNDGIILLEEGKNIFIVEIMLPFDVMSIGGKYEGGAGKPGKPHKVIKVNRGYHIIVYANFTSL